MLLYVHTTMRAVRDGETRNGHLDFHTAPSELFSEFRFSVALQFSSVLLYVHRNRRLIRLPPRLSHRFPALLLYVHRNHKDY